MHHTPEQLRRQLAQTPLSLHLNLLNISTSDQVRAQYPDLNPQAQAWYDPAADKITLLADRINPETAAFTAWHEMGHRNIAVSGWRKWQLAWLKARQENPLVDALACQIEQQRQTAGQTLNRTAAAEEAAAELYAAHKTRQYDEIEQRYGVTVPSVQRNTLGGFFARLQQKLSRIVRRALGKSAPDFADGQVYSLLQGMEKAEKTAAQQAGQPANALRYNLYEGENSHFAQVIDKIYSGKFTAQHKRLVDMGTTPEVLQMLGLPDVRITIRETTIEKAFRNQLRPDEHGHNINPETLKQLPAQLNNPIAVMKSKKTSSNPDALIVLTELTETELLSEYEIGRGAKAREFPVIAALIMNETPNGLDVINITSIHGRGYADILETLRDGALYWNGKKGSQFLTVSASTTPPTLRPIVQRIRSGANPARYCKTEADLAQWQDEKRQNTLRYNLYEGQNTRFARAIDGIYSGKFEAAHHRWVNMGTTPDVLQMLGQPDTNIFIRETTIEKAFRNQLRPDEHGHNINPETLKQLPAQLNNPIAVMKSKKTSSNPDALIVLTELTETELLSEYEIGRGAKAREFPVIAALIMNETPSGLDVINITSIHGRGYTDILETLRDGALYWNGEKGPQFLTVSASTTPPTLRPIVQRLRSGANPTRHCKTEADLAQWQDEKRQNALRFSLYEGDRTPFAKAVDGISKGYFEAEHHRWVNMGTTPDVLQMLGQPDTKIFIRQTTIEKAFRNQLRPDEHGHNINPETLKQLPAQLNNPIAVMRPLEDSTNPDSLLMLTELIETEFLSDDEKERGIRPKEKPVIAALMLNQTAKGTEVINITTVHGRVYGNILEMLQKGTLYWHKEKGSQFLTVSESNFPPTLATYAQRLRLGTNPNRHCKTEADLAQWQDEKRQNALRFSLYEGDRTPFAKAVDGISKGYFEAEHRRLVGMGTTPEVLQMLGLPDVRITIRQTTIEKAFRNQLRPDEHGHNINPETLKQLPAQLNNPIAVMKSKKTSSNPDALIVLTELTETELLSEYEIEHGAKAREFPVIAALIMNETPSGLDVINITSIHGRGYTDILETLRDGALYWNKEKGSQFLTVSASTTHPTLATYAQRLRSGANPARHCKTEADLAQWQAQHGQSDIRYSFAQHTAEVPTRSNMMTNNYPDPTYDEVRAALGYVDVPESYNDWYPYAFAIKDAVGDAGFDLWDEWSRRGSNYDAAQSKATWKSARPSPGGITSATLFKAARANGYRPDKPAQPLTAEQLARRETLAQEAAERAARELAEQHARAAKTAYGIWHNAEKTVDLSHGYLQKKGIADAELVRNIRQNEYKGQKQLVIPLWQEGKIMSVQTINEDGGKHFLKGGQKSGSYAFIGSKSEMGKGVVLAEGFATAASIRQATGRPVFIAFDAGNLAKVAEKLAARQDIPHVVIAADNDISGSGLKGAQDAWVKLNGKGSIVMPEFTPETIAQYQSEHGRIGGTDKENLPSDFNDLHKLAGIEAVREAFAAALERKEKEMAPEKSSANIDEEWERVLTDQKMLNSEKAAAHAENPSLETAPHSGEGWNHKGQHSIPTATPETAAPEAAVVINRQEDHMKQDTESKQSRPEQTGSSSAESGEVAEYEQDAAENEARLKAAAITTAASAALPGIEGASLATDAAVFAAQEVVDEKLADKIQEREGTQTAGKEEKQSAQHPENVIEYGNVREIGQEPERTEIIDVEEALANVQKKHAAEQKHQPSVRLPQTPTTESAQPTDSTQLEKSPDRETESAAPSKPKPILTLDYALPPSLEGRYIRDEKGKYSLREDHRRTMFRDHGGKIKTPFADRETVQAILDTAKAKNWDTIKVSGSTEFRREAWILGMSQGINVKGYRPNAQDLALLDTLQNENSRNIAEPGQTTRQAVEREKIAEPSAAALYSEADHMKHLADTPEAGLQADKAREYADRGANVLKSKTAAANAAVQPQSTLSRNALNSYEQKKSKLNVSAISELAKYEKRFREGIRGMDAEQQDEMLQRYYDMMSARMQGEKIDLPSLSRKQEADRVLNEGCNINDDGIER